jgi:hypothetical protein
MANKTFLFAPVTFDLAETTRMIEIAKEIINPLQQARHYGVYGHWSIFDYWRRGITLVAEPEEFTSVKLPPTYYYRVP